MSILGPVGPVGSLGPGRRKIQISQATQAKARIPGKFFLSAWVAWVPGPRLPTGPTGPNIDTFLPGLHPLDTY